MRIQDFVGTPANVRSILRRRFAPHLLDPAPHESQVPQHPILADEQVLLLLLNTTVSFAHARDLAECEYDKLLKNHPSAPPFDELVHNGWVRCVWERIHAGLDVRSILPDRGGDAEIAIRALMDRLRERQVYVSDGTGLQPDFTALITEMPNVDFEGIRCTSPL